MRGPGDPTLEAMFASVAARTLFDTAPVAIAVLDVGGRIVHANPALSVLLGRETSELLGTLMSTYAHTDDLEPPRVDSSRWLPDRDVSHRDKRFVHRSGRVLHVSITLSALQGPDGTRVGFVVHLADRTEREVTALRLARYQVLAERARDIILFVDAESGRIVEANDSAADAYGYSHAELLERNIQDLRAPETIVDVSAQMVRADLEGVLFETRHRRRDGTTFPVEVSSKGTVDTDRRVLLSIVRDISERNEAEQALRRAMETAEQLAQSKSQFLANMSHELRTPLNAILGFGRVLERETYGPLNERQRSYVDDIVQSGAHMLKLVNDLLDLRRLEEGRMLDAAAMQSPRPAFEEAVRMVRPLALARGLRFEAQIPEPSVEAWIDQRALVQILLNLLGNAVKFTPAGGTVALRAGFDEETLRIDVEDNGIGIDPSDQPRLFHYFEQAGREAGTSGTGLGLALTRALVLQLGGEIQLRSALARGSCFTVLLRRQPPS